MRLRLSLHRKSRLFLAGLAVLVAAIIVSYFSNTSSLRGQSGGVGADFEDFEGFCRGLGYDFLVIEGCSEEGDGVYANAKGNYWGRNKIVGYCQPVLCNDPSKQGSYLDAPYCASDAAFISDQYIQEKTAGMQALADYCQSNFSRQYGYNGWGDGVNPIYVATEMWGWDNTFDMGDGMEMGGKCDYFGNICMPYEGFPKCGDESYNGTIGCNSGYTNPLQPGDTVPYRAGYAGGCMITVDYDTSGKFSPAGPLCESGWFDNDSSSVCGNGVTESGEECDEGANNVPASLTATFNSQTEAAGTPFGVDPDVISGLQASGCLDNCTFAACSDTEDNDGDSEIDAEDAGCYLCNECFLEGGAGSTEYLPGKDAEDHPCEEVVAGNPFVRWFSFLIAQGDAPCEDDSLVCGDGTLDEGEACDDGNEADGDGCDALCSVEEGYVCENPDGNESPSVCTEDLCGNGNVDVGEECDGTPGCGDDCQFTTCGDGTVDPEEPCDPTYETGTPNDTHLYCTEFCEIKYTEAYCCTTVVTPSADSNREMCQISTSISPTDFRPKEGLCVPYDSGDAAARAVAFSDCDGSCGGACTASATTLDAGVCSPELCDEPWERCREDASVAGCLTCDDPCMGNGFGANGAPVPSCECRFRPFQSSVGQNIDIDPSNPYGNGLYSTIAERKRLEGKKSVGDPERWVTDPDQDRTILDCREHFESCGEFICLTEPSVGLTVQCCGTYEGDREELLGLTLECRGNRCCIPDDAVSSRIDRIQTAIDNNITALCNRCKSTLCPDEEDQPENDTVSVSCPAGVTFTMASGTVHTGTAFHAFIESQISLIEDGLEPQMGTCVGANTPRPSGTSGITPMQPPPPNPTPPPSLGGPVDTGIGGIGGSTGGSNGTTGGDTGRDTGGDTGGGPGPGSSPGPGTDDDVCPSDARACPDGTELSRDPNNNCQFPDCPEKHTVCQNEQCVEVDGAGRSECEEANDCKRETHMACDNNQCKEVDGPGRDACSGNDDCEDAVHLACRNSACIEVEGAGKDTCSSTKDCEDDTHLACVGNACTEVAGSEADSCSSAQDCEDEFHLECVSLACVQVPGAAEDTCSTADDCQAETHLECVAQQCMEVPGSQQDECDTAGDCEDETHLECVDNACTEVAGAAEDSCSTSDDCSDNRHLECVNQQCRIVAGAEKDSCSTNSDCEDEVHLECVDLQCAEVPGAERDSCGDDDDCTKETHLGCENQQCIELDGPGEDTCSANDDCVEVCAESEQCIDREVCESANGQLGDSCGTSEAFCCAISDTHLECENGACIEVDGFGEDLCSTSADCFVSSSSASAVTDASNSSSSSPAFSFASASVSSSGTLIAFSSSEVSVVTQDPPDSQADSSATTSSLLFSGFSTSFDERTHTVCFEQTCLAISGPGDNECDEALDCGTDFHLICENDACTVTPGAGANECTQSIGCGQHTECRNEQCIVVDGVAANECGGPEDCIAFDTASSRSSSDVTIIASVSRCGDGVVDPGEECDLGAQNSAPGTGGGCSCDPSVAGCIAPVSGITWEGCRWPRCGDGLVNNDVRYGSILVNFDLVHEECDDGNSQNGDGCSALCTIELEAPQLAISEPVCGDGSIDSGEQCDDGNVRSGDGCSALCTTEQTIVAAASICGNGTFDPGEECDDNNRRDNDGCNSTCLLEIGICGDGIVQSLLGEQCEQSTHNVSLPYACVDCRFVSASCGDGTVDAGEECDNGPLNSRDADADCRPDCALSRCGDGVLDSSELCDDGNRRRGDGCDSFCRVEDEKTDVAGETVVGSEFAQQVNFEAMTNGSVDTQFRNFQQFGFPQFPNAQQVPYQLPYAQLQPLIQTQAPIGDTGPAAVAVIGAGAAAGFSWMRRKKK